MKKYNHKKTERKWQRKWLKEKVYEPNLEKAKDPFYNLMMFPYPSAEGLHVGNVYAFTGSDIYGRFKRMNGYDVFEPIGLDGFGIHSENYAIKIGRHPAKQAEISEKNFYRQLGMIGNGFAWNEKLETYDPEYYKWTQWIFIQLYKKGIAYRKKAAVNWCPGCLTVLADEQVIAGECERCGAKVIKKELEQWFFRITQYADRLLRGLNGIDWSEKVKIAQRNWIGKSEGALIKFPLVDVAGQKDKKHFVEVFTTRPDTIFGATFVAVSPKLAQFWLDIGWQAGKEVKKYIKDHQAEKATDAAKEKSGVFSGVAAVNPANKEKIPVWISDYVLAGYGTGAVMGVPAHDERDLEFAKKFQLPISDAPLVSAEAGIKKSGGKKETQYRLRDWLISRQRYWGAPIPMIYCEKCNWQPVPEKDLPVKLPKIKNFRPTGTDQSPLAADRKFYKAKCPQCDGLSRRETDVSDTFLDSSWYYLGYLLKFRNWKLEIGNSQFSNLVRKWCPVDMYIGGAEHSVLHLLYVRFLAMVLHDLGLVDFEEPFGKFRAHGLLIKDGTKMSKSKGNVVNPDEYIENYGADVLRMCLMFIGPFDQGGDFRDSGILGVERFLGRVWQYSQDCSKVYSEKGYDKARYLEVYEKEDKSKKIVTSFHKTIKKVTEDIEELKFNTTISSLMSLLGEIFHKDESVYYDVSGNIIPKEYLESFIKLLAPLSPHIAEEIWREVLGHKESIHTSPWPKYDPKLVKENEVDFVVQVNGKMRAVLRLPLGSPQAEVEKAARSNDNISKHLSGKIKKVIFVKDKLINFVVL